MRQTAIRVTLAVGLAAGIATAGCGGKEEVAAGAITADTAPKNAAPIAEGMMGHGSHDPKHNGVVLMSDEYHFEAVLNPSGKYALYFTDMARNDLPATTATAAKVTITRPGEPPEEVPLKIDESGEGWVGEGKPVSDMQNTIARVWYQGKGNPKPYFQDIPFYTAQPGAKAAPAAPKTDAPPPALARPAEDKKP